MRAAGVAFDGPFPGRSNKEQKMTSMFRITALAASVFALAGCSSLGSTAATEREAASREREGGATGEGRGRGTRVLILVRRSRQALGGT